MTLPRDRGHVVAPERAPEMRAANQPEDRRMTVKIRTYAQLGDSDVSDLGGQVHRQLARLEERIRSVDRIVAVMSGKGGVGKSLTAAALAASARRADRSVGLLDADLNSPTATRFLGVTRSGLASGPGGIVPSRSTDDIAVISTSLLLEEGMPLEWSGDDADSFVWRGAQERGALREFLADVAWGELDLLFVDLPPGTGRLVELHEMVPRIDAAVAVTIPSEASRVSVERSLEACRRKGIPIAGVVENMSGYSCASCDAVGPLFPGSAANRIGAAFEVPVLGRVPFDPEAARLAEDGRVMEMMESTAAGTAWEGVAGALAAVLDRADRR